MRATTARSERQGECENENLRGADLRSQLGDLDSTVVCGEPVPVPPHRGLELRGAHDDLAQGDALAGRQRLDVTVYAGIESEDEPGVVAIEDEIAPRQKDLAGRRHGCGYDAHWR